MIERLTPSEKEVLNQVARGLTNKEIAETLFMNEKTVMSHRSNIFKKLRITHHLRDVVYAIKQGIR